MLLRFSSWIGPALIASAATLGAVWFADYLNAGKASDQVQANARELLMKCIQEENGVYRCRQLGGGQNEVITGPNNDGGDKNVTPEYASNE